MKRRGPKTDPWGTPRFNGKTEDSLPLKIIIADAGDSTSTQKNFGGWKSTAVMETCIEHSLIRKQQIGQPIVQAIHKAPCEAPQAPLKSAPDSTNSTPTTACTTITLTNCTINNSNFFTKD